MGGGLYSCLLQDFCNHSGTPTFLLRFHVDPGLCCLLTHFLEMLSQTQALLLLSLAGKPLEESLAMILTWFLESTVTPRAVPFSSSGTLVSFFLPHFYSAMEHGGQSRRTSTLET